MHREYSIINDGSKTHIIKQLTAVPPDIGIPKFTDAFIIEPVNLGNLSALMIPTYQSYPIGISYLRKIPYTKALDGFEYF